MCNRCNNRCGCGCGCGSNNGCGNNNGCGGNNYNNRIRRAYCSGYNAGYRVGFDEGCRACGSYGPYYGEGVSEASDSGCGCSN